VRDRDTVVLSDHGVGSEVLGLSEPATYFGGSPAGGLGWGIGGGLGMKLARPEKTFIVTAGDGTYMFNNPTACHFVSEAYNLPLLTIICNNAICHASKARPNRCPTAGRRHGKFPLTGGASRAKIVEAHGDGEMVDDPQRAAGAQRALKVVKGKRQAVLNVICGSH
jgi:acetolactate synthase-1/2/3 large subunit